MNTSVLEVKGLEKKFKHFKLGPLNFTLEKGMAVALLGDNGSGKSTFFRLLMNILQTEAGTISMFGENINENETESKRRIGYIGDLFEPFSSLKVKELAKLISRWYPNWDHDRYTHFINRYNINENEKFGKCSKGTKKKVEFVFSICHNPDILLLDEPSANLDIMSQRKLKEDLIHFMEDGEKSIVLATHNMDDVRQICDYITILEKGNILHSFEKDEIHEKWARLWITELPNELKNHPSIVSVNTINSTSIEVVTNQFSNGSVKRF
ncbi:ABC transporter ATP-binding protein, partial [Bacillus sp. AFS040349]|uniref:ATP-binding cassette domain-containing protein n=1 Tax=Bacillus sp. AFS040349 TaxID=2033502 RepID=UPI000BFC99CD